MARSPLLSSLVRIFKDIRIAEANNVSPHTVREWRDEAREKRRREGLGRRELMAGAGALAAATLAPKAHAAPTLPNRSVAVVGGGIAGLNAALTLKDKGATDITLYEANTRLGGRMHTNRGYYDAGQVTEWCGELIDTNHLTIRRLAQRFNLQVNDLFQEQPPGSEDTYYMFGSYYPRSQAVVDFLPVYDRLKQAIKDAPYPQLYNSNNAAGRQLDNTSVWQWIEDNVPGGHASPMGSMLDIAYTEELAVDSRLQSSLNLIYLLGYQPHFQNFEFFGESDERFHIAGGNDQLPLAMADALGGANGPIIKTGHALTKIRKESDGRVTLTVKKGNQTIAKTFDFVILAIPFAILRDLDYSQAGFDPLKHYTIQNLGMGRSGKVSTQFTNRMWNGTGAWPGKSNGNYYTDNGIMNGWDTTRGQAGAQGILLAYTGGPPSIALASNAPYSLYGAQGTATDVGNFLTRIDRIFPGVRARWNGKAAVSVPHKDPFLKLSYCHWKLGQYQQIAGYESVAQGNIRFAGEHTSVDFQGFMEGGAITGEAQALEVIKDFH